LAECLCGCGELTIGKSRFRIGGIENLLELKGYIDKYGYQELLDIIKSLKRVKNI